MVNEANYATEVSGECGINCSEDCIEMVFLLAGSLHVRLFVFTLLQ